MADLPLERIWRDARVERSWEGTSEFQRHLKLLIAKKCGQEAVPPELEERVLELIRRLDA